MDNFSFIYLAILVALVAGLLLLLRSAQKGALKALAQMLYGDKNPTGYLKMLDSRRLSLVLRKSTLALLRLEGHIQTGDAAGVDGDARTLDAMKLRPEEALEYGQKAMSFYLARGEHDKGRAYLKKLETLLEKEPDEKLRTILADARLLVGIYADRDTGLIPRLEEQEHRQAGGQRGLTQYRLAKLCHFGGQEEKAAAWLKKAAANVGGTSWQAIVAAAQEDHKVLDER